MRAMFGVGARTEILRFLLLNPGSDMSAVALAEATSYAKRNIAEECDLLVQSGLLSTRTVGNRFYYSLKNARALANFVGETPPIAPDWNALLRVVGTVNTLANAACELSNEIRVVEVHQAALDIGSDLARLGIEGPRRLPGAAFLDSWDQWVVEVMADLASGAWPMSEGESPEAAVGSRGRAGRTPVHSR
jgi:hypothetical protein